MKIVCDCGKVVAEGEIKNNDKGKKRFYLEGKLKGAIVKHHSNNPKNWEGICSQCQKPKKKKGEEENEKNN